MERRNTVQKELVLNAVRSMKSHVTAEEVHEYITATHPNISKGTVYRNLNILSEAGEIRKVEVADGPVRYDFTLADHYHVRCIKCGDVSDVDIDVLPSITDKIKETHGMHFLSYDILFRGICEKCQTE